MSLYLIRLHLHSHKFVPSEVVEREEMFLDILRPEDPGVEAEKEAEPSPPEESKSKKEKKKKGSSSSEGQEKSPTRKEETTKEKEEQRKEKKSNMKVAMSLFPEAKLPAPETVETPSVSHSKSS